MLEQNEKSLKDQAQGESQKAMLFVPYRYNRPQMLPPLICSRRLYVHLILLLVIVFMLVIIRLMSTVKVNFVHFHLESDSDAELVTLPSQFAHSRGALCLDGSPPAYYFRPSLLSVKFWIIYLPGGAWCNSEYDCFQRSLTELGSSHVAKISIPMVGILSNDCEINPDFCLWNVLVLHYCDGSSFLGNDSTVRSYESQSLYLRGAVVLEALIDYLKESTDLAEAEQVVLAGSSAGGIAALIHADRLRTMLPHSVKTVHALVDAAMFLDLPDVRGNFELANLFKSVYSFHSIENSKSIQECTETQPNITERWRCLLPEVYYKFVFTPIYFVNSVYDTWQRTYLLKISCFASACPSVHRDVVYNARDSILTFAHNITRYKKNGVYLTWCPVHTILNQLRFSSAELGDSTVQQSLSSWLQHDLSQITGDKNFLSLEAALEVCKSSIKL
uniref:Pectin acetylesterase n=1 Tax=Biomphalaria glabrata TaxID=6526 RepID=A0A2C9LBW4_BIOGL